jgi:hypothetical protein
MPTKTGARAPVIAIGTRQVTVQPITDHVTQNVRPAVMDRRRLIATSVSPTRIGTQLPGSAFATSST